jgi:hypothetical protein
MEKRKLLSVILFCLCFAGITLADEVINVDLNAQGDTTAYTGVGAIAGETVWRAIYEGTGVAVGSARTYNLANYDEPNKVSIYAAQVWLVIPEDGLFDKVDDGTSGNALMDDGFEDNGSGNDPCLIIPGVPQDPCNTAGAYIGTYDIYVYCSAATQVKLISSAGTEVNDVTGSSDPTTSASYAYFKDVTIDVNSVTIVWNNIINGITLVKKKTPLQIDTSTYPGNEVVLWPTDYDAARETNGRGGGQYPEMELFGPDFAEVNHTGPTDANYSGPYLAYLDNGEYVLYDFVCSAGNDGVYQMDANVVPFADDTPVEMTIYYYNDVVEEEVEVGTLSYTPAAGQGGKSHVIAPAITFNIFEGSGYLKCEFGNGLIYWDLVNLRLWNLYDDVDMTSCDDVKKYKYEYVSDYTGDCHVDINDLDLITEHWVECYSPDVNDCL